MAAHNVVIVGGAYGGLAAALSLLRLVDESAATANPEALLQPLARLDRGLVITVIDERDGLYHTVGSPLATASKSFVARAWKTYHALPELRRPDLTFRKAKALSLDCSNQRITFEETDTKQILEESYDYLLVSTGLRRDWPIVPRATLKDDYVREVLKHISGIESADQGVVVIGGGAVGVEVAAELKLVFPKHYVTLVHSRQHLLSNEPLPDEFKEVTLRLLKEAGVRVILGSRVVRKDITGGGELLTLDDGSTLTAGKSIFAASKWRPNSEFLPQTILDAEGYVRVREFLDFAVDAPNPDNHFAIGDVAKWSGIKRVGNALAMGQLAAGNIFKRLLKDEGHKEVQDLVVFPEVPPMIGLALGRKAATYHPDEGVKAGEDQMRLMFGDDLGLTACLKSLQLSEGK